MGNLIIPCDTVVEFLKDHQFALLDKLEGFKFSDNTIKFKIKIKFKVLFTIKFKPKITIRFKSFNDGTWHVEADTGEFIEDMAKLFGATKKFKKNLESGEFKDVITMENDLNFKIKVNKFLEDYGTNPKTGKRRNGLNGIKITDIRLNDKKQLVVDFDV
ncbi:MAG: hypothetical protein GY940_25670 [bacterium]|nr:hypothetical protein [bacterium]